MKNAISSSLLLVLFASSGAVLAAEHQTGMNHAAMQGMQHKDSAMQGHMGVGVVNKIDMQHGKVNMTHGPIKALGWSGMTMDFKVKDMAIMKGIKPGQKVGFDVVKDADGQYCISRIAPSR